MQPCDIQHTIIKIVVTPLTVKAHRKWDMPQFCDLLR